MRTISSIPKFARACGFSTSSQKGFRKHLNYLVQIRALEIQQGGFLGDNIHHHKLVVIRDEKAVKQHFSPKTREIPIDLIENPSRPKKREAKTETWEHEEISRPHSVQYYALKCTARKYYIRIPSAMIGYLGIKTGDLLKVKLIEAYTHRELLGAA
jgi:predicted metalloenzyme YecM